MMADHRIPGTRISVWDVLHHVEHDWSLEDIAEVFDISVEQVQAAVEYIHTHHAEVMRVHREIEARNARGNSPETQKRINEARDRRLEWLELRENIAAQ